MKWRHRWNVVLVSAALLVAGCADGNRPQLTDDVAAPRPPTPVPTPEAVNSAGEITVGEWYFPLDFRCFDVDGTSTFAVGKGSDPRSGEEVTVLVQQFPDVDYVALVFGDVSSGRAWEPAVDEPFEVVRTGNVLQADGLTFFDYGGDDADAGELIGEGGFEVRCAAFEVNIPEDVFPSGG